MRTDPNVATDGTILGLDGETYCATAFLYDARGGRGGCALEAIEYQSPALQRDASPLRGLRIHLDLIHHHALHEVLQCPAHVREIDSVHRRAEALAIAQYDDLLLGVLMGEAVYQVNLCAD